MGQFSDYDAIKSSRNRGERKKGRKWRKRGTKEGHPIVVPVTAARVASPTHLLAYEQPLGGLGERIVN